MVPFFYILAAHWLEEKEMSVIQAYPRTFVTCQLVFLVFPVHSCFVRDLPVSLLNSPVLNLKITYSLALSKKEYSSCLTPIALVCVKLGQIFSTTTYKDEILKYTYHQIKSL